MAIPILGGQKAEPTAPAAVVRAVHIWGEIMTPIEIVIVLTCMGCFGLWLGAADRA